MPVRQPRRPRLSVPGAQGPLPVGRGRAPSRAGPQQMPGATRTSSPPAWSGRSPPVSPTAGRPASGRPGSRPERPWRTSTSTTSAASSATSSPTSERSTSSRPSTTPCSSARPGPARATSSIALGIRACLAGHRVAFATAAEWVDRLGEAHEPASSKTSSAASGGSRSSSSTRSATSPLRARPPTSSSSWSRLAMSGRA